MSVCVLSWLVLGRGCHPASFLSRSTALFSSTETGSLPRSTQISNFPSTSKPNCHQMPPRVQIDTVIEIPELNGKAGEPLCSPIMTPSPCDGGQAKGLFVMNYFQHHLQPSMLGSEAPAVNAEVNENVIAAALASSCFRRSCSES